MDNQEVLPNIVLNLPAIEEANIQEYQNSIWTKFIPTTNKIFIIISLLFVFGLDLLILIRVFELLPFWIEMLIALGIFYLFYYFENHRFSIRFSDSKSPLDPWIYAAVVIRNIIIFLNFIPFIQLLGLWLVMLAGVPYLIVYLVLIALRNKNTR